MRVRQYIKLVEKVQKCNDSYNMYYKGKLEHASLQKLDSKLLFFESELKKAENKLSNADKDIINTHYGVLLF